MSDKTLSDQQLFSLLGTELSETVERQLRERGYSEEEIQAGVPKEESSQIKDEIAVESEKQEDRAELLEGLKDEAKTSDEVLKKEDIKENVKSKSNNKKLIILGAILVAALAIAFGVYKGTEFKRVENKAVKIAGRVQGGKNYFTIDTFPDEYENMDEVVVGILKSDTQDKALEGIKYVNEALGFSGAVYSDMLNTTALMGRQSAENNKYRVSWTYHPDDGLEVTYEKK